MPADLQTRLAQRLDRLENHLAFVVSLHLFVENLVNALIEERSRTPTLILEDHRAYSFSVKLTLVFNMRLIPEDLFKNLRVLNKLRNQFGHEIDANLGVFFKKDDNQLFDKSGSLKADIKALAGRVEEELEEGLRLLVEVRKHTFDWLHEVCATAGVVR